MSTIKIEYYMPDNIKEKITVEIPQHAVGLKVNGYGLKVDAEGLEVSSNNGGTIVIEPVASNVVYITEKNR